MNFIFDPSLALYLPLYDLDGASFASRDAYGHLCTVSGALWRPYGHYFDGSDDKIDCGSSDVFKAAAITIEVWAYLLAILGSGRDTFIGRADLGNQGWELALDSSGKLRYIFKPSGTLVDRKANAVLTTGRWYHLAATTGKYLRMFVNGEVDYQDSGDTITYVDAQNVWFGASNGNTNWLNGLIGEVRVYNRALTPLEIQHNYLATKRRYR